MPQLKSSAPSPQAVMDRLMREVSHIGNKELMALLANAEAILPAMMQPQYERCVTDVAAGAVAAIISTFCCKQQNTPVVVVCETTEKGQCSTHLKAVIQTLQKLDYLDHHIEMVNKEPARKYLCLKRLHNSQANGNDFPAKIENRLTINGLNQSTASKICVTTCSKGCAYYQECRYQNLMRHMADGRIQIQIYDVQQYRSALRANKLPKTRITVCSPVNSRILLDDGTRSLKAQELEKLLLQSERLCSSARHKRIAVLQETAIIRKDSQQLFGMAASQLDEIQAKRLLLSINSGLLRIRQMCIKELTLWGDERTKWRKNLDRAIADTAAISAAPFKISRDMLTSA